MTAKKLESVDIVLTVYNQEEIISRIVRGVLKNTITPFNFILVFDACRDKSKANALAAIERSKTKFLKDVIFIETPDVHETRSNNAGLKAATSDYAIILQDDMEIREPGWEIRMTYPMRIFPDVAAVGSRGGLDIVSMAADKQVYKNRAGREFWNISRNTFAVRDYVNRGPIAFDRHHLAEAGFFDERFAPCNLDDANFCLSAWQKHRLKCGIYWIDYFSDEKWSKTKQTPLEIRAEPRSRAKNSEILARDYAEYLQSGKKHTEDIEIPWQSVDYPEGFSRSGLRARIFISQARFLLQTAGSKIRRFFYRLEIKMRKTKFSTPYSKQSEFH